MSRSDMGESSSGRFSRGCSKGAARGIFQMKARKTLTLAASLCTAFLFALSPLSGLTGESPDLEVEAAGVSAQAAAPETQAVPGDRF